MVDDCPPYLYQNQYTFFGGGGSITHLRTMNEEACNNTEESGQGEGGGLAESGHPFQSGLCKREEGI